MEKEFNFSKSEAENLKTYISEWLKSLKDKDFHGGGGGRSSAGTQSITIGASYETSLPLAK